MKLTRFLFFLIFLITPLSIVYSQNETLNSSIRISIRDNKYFISGVVSDEQSKTQISEKVRKHFNQLVDLSQINVQSKAAPLKAGWEKGFDNLLLRIKKFRSGIFIYSGESNHQYPIVPEEIAETVIQLDNETKISPFSDENKAIILFFIESWCGPCLIQAEELEKTYQKVSSRKIELIAVSTETSKKEKQNFRDLFKQRKLNFKYGWIEDKVLDNFIKISRISAVPQTFVVFNKRLYGMFVGGGNKSNDDLNKAILEVLNENNL